MTKFLFGSGLNAWDDLSASLTPSPSNKFAVNALTGILGYFIGGPKGFAAGLTIFSATGPFSFDNTVSFTFWLRAHRLYAH